MASAHSIVNCSTILHQILREYCEILNRNQHQPTSQLIVSEDHTRYLIIRAGWIEEQRIHSLLFDGEIRDNKIWLHHDGLNHGIVEDLLAAGIDKESIVLAFHPPDIREHTGYAIA